MKAACTAAKRGHQVTIAERANELGGQLLLNRNIPGRREMVTAATDLINNLRVLNVNILLGKEVDRRLVKDMKPDVVILATGASPLLPNIPGIETKGVVTAWEVLCGKTHVGEKVVIVGGNAVGLETALYLADQGTLPPEVLHFLVANRAESWETLERLVNSGNKHVTVVEMMKRAGQDIGSSTRWTVMMELRRLGVTILTNTKALGIKPEGVDPGNLHHWRCQRTAQRPRGYQRRVSHWIKNLMRLKSCNEKGSSIFGLTRHMHPVPLFQYSISGATQSQVL
jgi:2,4-dienoyl-CoA reductase (NADPH2)